MSGPVKSSADARAERLAQSLRVNLHRRKAQARAIDAQPREPDATPPESN
jgi:hypothetical protein